MPDSRKWLHYSSDGESCVILIPQAGLIHEASAHVKRSMMSFNMAR